MRMPSDGIDVITRIENDQNNFYNVVLPPGGAEAIDGADLVYLEKEGLTLTQLLAAWLNHLGLADDVEANSDDYGKVKLRVRIAGDKGWSPLEHVGTGVSVVLPILYACITSKEGDTLIIEEPEAHLHPQSQEAIADVLAAYASAKRQIFVETHSELVVNRFRVLAASGHLSKVDNGARVLMVKKEIPDDTGWQQTTYTTNLIRDDGSFDGGWIDEFLGVGAKQYEALLRHSMGVPSAEE